MEPYDPNYYPPPPQQGPPGVWKQVKPPAVFGPIIFAAGLIAALVMCFISPSIDIPLVGSQSCGASSLEIVVSNVGATDIGSTSNSFSDRVAEAVVKQCNSSAEGNVVWALLALVGGIVVGSVVWGQERKPRWKIQPY